ncbi:MAG: CRISPR system precrRNA processing endoribonuclease RAMP protein Cas6, partial [Planctomycetales bacterium]|nr:CRISPR system precrRNA processing endoribonuclease RAMP protein Cas6 [Planctomycetales bacterium]
LKSGERFAFGGGLIGPNSSEAGAVVERLRDGLRRLGSSGKPRRQGFGGNFELAEVEDLVAGAAWTGGPLRSLAAEQLNGELRQLGELSEFNIRFLSPLRIERPGRHKQTGRSFFDNRFFDLPYFLSRLLRRMQSVGVVSRDGEATQIDPAAVEVLENRLVWIDMAYGGPHGKVLGGAVGRVRLRIDDPTARAALVWGQYTRVGKNAHFGFGRYRIESLGADPLACRRAMPLLESAWTHPRADALAMQAGLDAGRLTATIEAVRTGEYVPLACQRLTFGQGERSRQLHIPARIDRVLQRLALESLGPGLDQFLESSSFAWRRGLGRHSSARAIGRAFRQGFVYAVKADIDRFFDTVDRQLLADRLDAYLADDQAVELLLAWVRSGGDTGLPTGAPLSPLLANLFLDHFDERIANRGGRLVRYGDDFLILCRTSAEADALLSAAREEAAELLLRLND